MPWPPSDPGQNSHPQALAQQVDHLIGVNVDPTPAFAVINQGVEGCFRKSQ
jgi:hypothetical protein